jgi:hypothetical protein
MNDDFLKSQPELLGFNPCHGRHPPESGTFVP